MQKTLRHLALATLVATTGMAHAQTQNMVIVKKDGTQLKFNVAQVDSVKFKQIADEAQGTVNLKIDSAHPYYLQVSTKPQDLGTYNLMYLGKDEYTYATDAACVADDLAYYQQLASYYNMTLADVLSQVLLSDATTEYVGPILPGDEVVVWAYGMDATNGAQTSPFEKFTATAPTVPVGSGTVSVAVDGSNVVFTPDNDSRYYCFGLVPNSYTDQDVTDNMMAYLGETIVNGLYDGSDAQTTIAEQCAKGKYSIASSDLGVDGEVSGYDAVAVYVNEEGVPCSAISRCSLENLSTTTSSVKGIGFSTTKAHLFQQVKPQLRIVRAGAAKLLKK